MENDLRAHLFACADAFIAYRKRMKRSTLGRIVAGDGRFFDRIEAGASFTARKYDDVVGWFSENWPAGVEWPAEVPRPIEVAA